MTRLISVSPPSWKSLQLPLFFTVGVPVLQVVALFALACFSPAAHGVLVVVGFAPLLSIVLAYFYFPWVVARKRFFQRHNGLKSVALGLITFESNRQLFISLMNGFGISLTSSIHQKCGPEVDTLWEASVCGMTGTLTFIGLSFFLWVLPAALLASVSIRPVLSATQRGEA